MSTGSLTWRLKKRTGPVTGNDQFWGVCASNDGEIYGITCFCTTPETVEKIIKRITNIVQQPIIDETQ